MGMIDKDEFLFIISERSSYYEVHFDVALKDGGVAPITYMATPGPHVFNRTTLEITWCMPKNIQRLMDTIATVTVLKSCTMEQEVCRRMRLMDKFLAKKKCSVRVGISRYTALADGKVMVDDDVNKVISIADMTTYFFDLDEHTVHEE